MLTLLFMSGCGNDDGSSAAEWTGTPAETTTSGQLDAAEQTTAFHEGGSFDLCTSRLAFGQALFAIDHPDERGPDALRVLKDIEPPPEIAKGWTEVIDLAEQAVMLGDESEEVPDTETFDIAYETIRLMDFVVIDQPCVPSGLEDDFGCESLRGFAEKAVSESADSRIAIPQVLASVEAIGVDQLDHCWDEQHWEELDADLPPQPICKVSKSDGNASEEFLIEFGTTSCGRYFAWLAQ